jgi:hypothetical protein
MGESIAQLDFTVRDSIDIDNYSETDTSSQSGSECDLQRVKIEQPDPSYKSSCQFQNTRTSSFENVGVLLRD